MDSKLEGQYSLSGAQKVAKLASQCLSADPVQRPSMEQVVKVLAQLQDDKKIDKKKLSLSHGSKVLAKGESPSAIGNENKGISRWLKSSWPKRAGVDTNTAALPAQGSPE